MLSRDQIVLLKAVAECSRASGTPVYLIGGVIRDLLQRLPVHDRDIDLVVEGDAQAFARVCAATTGGKVETFDRFRTAKIVAPDAAPSVAELDFASTRTENYARPGALPDVKEAVIEQDLARRDFTINALALSLEKFELLEKGEWDRLPGAVLDQFGGLEDLNAKLVRILHEKSFLDDPTRIFRGARYVVRVGGRFEERTETLLRAAVSGGALQSISLVRKLNELRHVFDERESGTVIQLLSKYGVLSEIGLFPHEQEARVTAGLIRLGEWQKRSTTNFSYDAALRFFCTGRTPETAGAWHEANISRKQLAAIEQDAAAVLGSAPAGELSDLALITRASLTDTPDKSLIDEIVRRGIADAS